MPRLSKTIRLSHWYDFYAMGGKVERYKTYPPEVRKVIKDLAERKHQEEKKRHDREVLEKLKEANELPDQCPIDD